LEDIDLIKELDNAVKTKVEKPEVELVEKNDKKNKLIKALNYLNSLYDFVYNEMSTKIEFKKKEDPSYIFLGNMEYENIRMEMKFNNIFVGENDFRGLLNSSRVVTKINPIKDYIFSLPKWNGKTDWISKLLDNLILEDENKREEYLDYFKRWFVAMVCGLIDDTVRIESINHTCLVLVGGQGKGKTKFFNDLLPEKFRSEYSYSGNFQMENKDHVIMLATKLLINLDELATLNKSELEMVKSRMTQTHVSLRKAYDKTEINLKRRASFCGTTNNSEVLRDNTGSRRFLMLSISDIKNDNPVDISLVWAQAFTLYKSGFKYWFSGDDIQIIEKNNDYYTSSAMGDDLLIMHFRKPDGRSAVSYLSATQIVTMLSQKYIKWNINDSVKRAVGTMLSKLGYKKVMKRVLGTPQWLWEVEVLGMDVEPRITDMDDTSLPPLEHGDKPLPF